MTRKKKSSWKTTVTGLGAIAAALAPIFFPEYALPLAKVSAVLGGAGLLAARDHSVSSDAAGVQ